MDGVTLKIVYKGTDISTKIEPSILSLTYTDILSGQSDELEMELEDSAGLWVRSYNPQKGDKIEAQIGYPGRMLDCGQFELDDIEYSGPPDVVRLKGLATGLKPGYRTQVTKWHQIKTLGGIATEIAGKYGVTVAGAPEGVSLGSVFQNGEDDLSFLRRVGDRFGYGFKVAHNQLVFCRVGDYESKTPVTAITRDSVTQYSLRTSGEPVCRSVELKYYDPKRKGMVSGSASNSTAVVGEKVRVDVRCTSTAEQQAAAEAGMESRQREEDEISFAMPGAPELIAGVVVQVKGWGVFDRDYLVKESRHSIARGEGYTVELKLQKSLKATEEASS